MSMNISGTRYVRVYDPSIRLNFSDKIVFANLVTSRATGNSRVDKETGEVLINSETGAEVAERAFSRWEGRFVGNAFEASKGLKDGDSIDIINGWITNEPFEGKDGKKHYSTQITISEFTLSNVEEGDDSSMDDE